MRGMICNFNSKSIIVVTLVLISQQSYRQNPNLSMTIKQNKRKKERDGRGGETALDADRPECLTFPEAVLTFTTTAL